MRRGASARASEWLRLGEAAALLGVSQGTLRAWSELGRVPTYWTPGGHRRYRRADLDQLLARAGRDGAELDRALLDAAGRSART